MSDEFPRTISVATARLHDALRVDLETEIDPAGLMLRAASRIGRLERDIITLTAERDALLEAAKGLVDYRDGVGVLSFQLEKADDWIEQLRTAIEEVRK